MGDADSHGGASRTGVEPDAIGVTPEARAALEQLIAEHGPLMFIESHGCCDNSAPMCFAEGEFLVGSSDIQIGEVVGCPYYVDARTLRFRNTGIVQLSMRLDVEPGYSDGMSLGPPGGHFVIRPVVAALPGGDASTPTDLSRPT